MKTLFLSPHNDDETLFGAFTLLRYRPHVIVCLRSQVQEDRGYGITYHQREAETDAAMTVLGCEWQQWSMSDAYPNWIVVEELLACIKDDYELVFAPLPLEGGHDHHNMLGLCAKQVFGTRVHVQPYLTYTTEGKAKGLRVTPELAWIGKKLQALACYESQYSHWSCQEHFLREQQEYYG